MGTLTSHLAWLSLDTCRTSRRATHPSGAHLFGQPCLLCGALCSSVVWLIWDAVFYCCSVCRERIEEMSAAGS